ncbi:MAG TPA: hypothetical protein VF266_02095 [Thermoanaerobaculia bacterium]
MKRLVAIALFIVTLAPVVEAARVRVKRGPAGRTRVTVTRGFPIRRTLPTVTVRTRTVRVAPRVYLAPVAFTAVAVASLPKDVWTTTEMLDRDEGWTDFTMDVDRRGTRLLLDIDRGTAQLSFAEVVFENGETQVVDFNDRVHTNGIYELVDFRSGRKVDHVRIVAKADRENTAVRLHLVQ